jgi:hypothetical protein
MVNCVLLLTVAGVGSAHGQGLVNFNNRVIPGVFAPIYGPHPNNPGAAFRGNATTNGGTVNYQGAQLLMGTGYTAALYAGPGVIFSEFDTNLQFVASTTFRTNAALGGIVQVLPTAVVVSNVAPGQPATMQLRVWENYGGVISNWNQAFNCRLVARGSSDLFMVTLGPGTNTAEPAAALTGLTSFSLFVGPDLLSGIIGQPQPAAIALGQSTNLTLGLCSCGPGAKVEWRLRGATVGTSSVSLSPFGTATLALTNVGFDQAGGYSAVVNFSNCAIYFQTSQTAVVTVPPRFAGIGRVSNNAFNLIYDAPPGLPLTVEMRPTLTSGSWTTLGTVTNPFVRGQFLDSTATNQFRAYRLRL